MASTAAWNIVTKSSKHTFADFPSRGFPHARVRAHHAIGATERIAHPIHHGCGHTRQQIPRRIIHRRIDLACGHNSVGRSPIRTHRHTFQWIAYKCGPVSAYGALGATLRLFPGGRLLWTRHLCVSLCLRFQKKRPAFSITLRAELDPNVTLRAELDPNVTLRAEFITENQAHQQLHRPLDTRLPYSPPILSPAGCCDSFFQSSRSCSRCCETRRCRSPLRIRGRDRTRT